MAVTIDQLKDALIQDEIVMYLKSVSPAELLDHYLTATTDIEEDADNYLPSGMTSEIEIMIQFAIDRINYSRLKSAGSGLIEGCLEN